MNNQAFSIMKGIAIISVVLGHCTTNSRIEAFVNQYHLAVFFFVAGFFFKEKYVVTPMDFIWKKGETTLRSICGCWNWLSVIT